MNLTRALVVSLSLLRYRSTPVTFPTRVPQASDVVTDPQPGNVGEIRRVLLVGTGNRAQDTVGDEDAAADRDDRKDHQSR